MQILAVAVRLGVAPRMDGVLRLAPVDWVSSVIRALAERADSIGRAYHLAGLRPVLWNRLVDAVAGPLAGDRLDYPEWRQVVRARAERTGERDVARLALVLGEQPPFAGAENVSMVQARDVLGDGFDRGYPAVEEQLAADLCRRLAQRPVTGR